MLYRRLSLLVFITLGISSCSKSDQSVEDYYLKANNGSSNIVVPSGVSTPKASPYYKIPSVHPQGKTPPSIHPPVLSGASKVSSSVNVASTHVSSHSQKRAVLILPEHNAWEVLGRALSDDARLKVINKDESKRIYYVLDTKKTSGEIKKNTPVYLIGLQPVKAGFLVVITDKQSNQASIEAYNTLIKSIKGYLL
ncbi:MAG: hypothetical protein CMF55_05965 [Legionellales bacterium]|nr:hypothetical protein [Legionellales bacterium]